MTEDVDLAVMLAATLSASRATEIGHGREIFLARGAPTAIVHNARGKRDPHWHAYRPGLANGGHTVP